MSMEDWARKIEVNDDEHFFLWRWELVIVTYTVLNKTPESIFQITRGQWDAQ